MAFERRFQFHQDAGGVGGLLHGKLQGLVTFNTEFITGGRGQDGAVFCASDNKATFFKVNCAGEDGLDAFFFISAVSYSVTPFLVVSAYLVLDFEPVRVFVPAGFLGLRAVVSSVAGFALVVLEEEVAGLVAQQQRQLLFVCKLEC